MSQTLTTPSTRRLSEVARHVVIPSGIVTTGWPAVESRCREWGDEFDNWQSGLGQVMLGKRSDGVYAATVGGITISIPRQVAKTFLVGRTVTALCVEFPGLKVLWTAHRTRTATNTFRTLEGFVSKTKVKPHISAIRKANGEQEIAFTNDSVIMFGARADGFGRGFDEVDVVVFDEAQILTVKALEDMVPATNQSRHPHGALLFFMGTPPRPTDPGEVFTLRRDEALSGDSDDAVYIECSAERGSDPEDRKQWAKANPSFPSHTPLRSMLRMRKNMPGEDSWRREALGIWDEVGKVRLVISPSVWSELVTSEPPRGGTRAYGVKFSPDGETVALSVALRPVDGPVHVEGIEHRSIIDGTKWLVDWISERWRSGAVMVDGKAGAGAFIRALRRAGVPERKVTVLNTEQAVAAHAGFLDAITEEAVSHLADPALEMAVGRAIRRPIGTAGGWGLQGLEGGDVTLLESVILAHYGAITARYQKTTDERRAVLL